MDTGPDTAGRPTDLESVALISEMRGRIEDLREQLQAERQAHAEARRLLAAALERIPPQLEAPESPESPGPYPYRRRRRPSGAILAALVA
jgi:ferric-dicitrate binding protein FerR (iron transport regulator)